MADGTLPRFSSRLKDFTKTNRISRALEQKRTAGESVLDLTISNPTEAGFAYDGAAILEALSQPGNLAYHPEPAGIPSARAAVSDYYARRGVTADPNDIILAASTSEAYSYLFKLLTEPGDEIVVPSPSYPLFGMLASMDRVVLTHYRLGFDGDWWLDFESLAHSITKRTRAIVAVNPNNPTGSYLKETEARRLVEFCEDHQLALICDEVFLDFGISAAGNSLAIYDKTPVFILNGLSKTAGLPQMKLAWIVLNGPDDWRRAAHGRLETIADTYLSVSTPCQLALPAWLESAGTFRSHVIKRLHENLDQLADRFSDSGCQLFRPEAGWSCSLRLPAIHTDEEWVLNLMLHDNVLVYPGYFFDFPQEAVITLSLLTPAEDLAEGARRIAARVRQEV